MPLHALLHERDTVPFLVSKKMSRGFVAGLFKEVRMRRGIMAVDDLEFDVEAFQLLPER